MNGVTDMRLAVLIDADNVVRSDMKAIIGEVTKYGTPVVKRAYGDWASQTLAGWKDVLLEIGAVPVQQYAYTTGKNATDVAMVIDAMDFLHDDCVEGFVLVSSDSDFTPLALRLRESGKKVFGIGEKKTPKPFIKACDKFIYAEILRPSPEVTPVQKVDGQPKTSADAKPVEAVPVNAEKSIQSCVSTQSGIVQNNDPSVASFLAAVTSGVSGADKVAKKSSSVATAPGKKPVSAKTVKFIAQCISELAGDDGRCALSGLGSLLSKNRPDFDSRNYGYSQLSKLLRSIDRFEVTGSGGRLLVKDKNQSV